MGQKKSKQVNPDLFKSNYSSIDEPLKYSISTKDKEFFQLKKKKCCFFEKSIKQRLKDEDWFKHLDCIIKNDFEGYEWGILIKKELESKFVYSESLEYQEQLFMNSRKFSSKDNLISKFPEQTNKLINQSDIFSKQNTYLDDVFFDTVILQYDEQNFENDFSFVATDKNKMSFFIEEQQSRLKINKQSSSGQHSLTNLHQSSRQKNKNVNALTLILDQQRLNEDLDILNAVTFYKKVTNFIQTILRTKNNPLCCMKRIFIKYFEQNYSNSTQMNVVVNCIDEINAFLDFQLEVIRVYLDIDFICNDYSQNLGTNQINYLSTDNLSNFLCCILFSHKEIYNLIMKISLDNQKEESQNFVDNLKKLYNKDIDQYEISPQFQLNANSYIFMKSKNLNFVQKNSSLLLDIPYKKAIDYLAKLNTVKAPLHKLKVILKTTELIDICIQDFYKENYQNLVKYLRYDADQFISLYCYIIVKSKNYTLPQCCFIIENFTYKGTLKSASGYLLITLMACIQIISQNMQIKSHLKQLQENAVILEETKSNAEND